MRINFMANTCISIFRYILIFCCVCVSCASAAENVNQPLDLIEAETQKLVSVKYIPNNSKSAQIIVTNKSNKPLTLKLPNAFAGVPVLAQFGMGGIGGIGGNIGAGAGLVGNAQTTGGGGMGMGGGMGGMGGGMGGIGGIGGGMFSVPAEKTKVVKVATVCLEHGKPEPNPRLSYKLVHIESFSSDPQLLFILEELGRGFIPQKIAQAAAWHLSSGLSWQQLAAEMIDHAGGYPDTPYFTGEELLIAKQIVQMSTKYIKSAPQELNDKRINVNYE